MNDAISVSDVLQRLQDEAKAGNVAVGTLVDALNSRGFGPLLLAPALVAMLPTGGIPGVPTVCGVLIFLIALQGSLGMPSPWVPRRLRRLAIQQQAMIAMTERAMPVASRLDRWFRPRLGVLTRAPVSQLVALFCAISGLAMIPLEVIPFASGIPALAVTLVAISMTTRDGALVVLAGLAVASGAGLLILMA
ncbi:exopolysaccharide biosynthesis protein [Halomonas sp. 18H]|uniref:exopolysaccharide biosynthesis protein n=1 Tax=Halomonas almeriensis TaxID=308163 RepID=UPI00222E0E11|nr:MULTISPECIES: exopolysaccharide biosynthesis protein [Halomonas]MCW4152940.1 exopolysaccharide biosynthesis protein [Halomonas sp. 18H]MDN3553132.1 exopolysaccharide biosynthesis protein [Halomonas almeriensis]